MGENAGMGTEKIQELLQTAGLNGVRTVSLSSHLHLVFEPRDEKNKDLVQGGKLYVLAPSPYSQA